MKKSYLSIIALVCAAAALAVSVYSCISLSHLVNAQNAQIEALLAASAQASQPEEAAVSLVSWELTPRVREDGAGADVVFTGTLTGSISNSSVFLDVKLMDADIGLYPCAQSGEDYTATACLDAENGYSYTCVVLDADGSTTSFPLTSPGDLTDPLVVNLLDSLSSYSNLLIDSWVCEGDTLTVTGGYVQVQLPLIGSEAGSPANATLSLRQNGNTLASHVLELNPGEGDGSYEAELRAFTFTLAGAAENGALELWLEVSAGGKTDSVCGAEWYLENGELLLVAG